MPVNDSIRIRRGTDTEWSSANPVLNDGEIGFDTTNKIIKVGDGTSTWSNLTGIGSGATGLSDGNKGNITVSNSGASWTINAGAVVTADIADGAVTRAKLAATAVPHPFGVMALFS